MQALDRVLTTGRYVIPFWFNDKSFIAYKADLKLSRAAAGLWRLDRLAAGGLVAGAEVAAQARPAVSAKARIRSS